MQLFINGVHCPRPEDTEWVFTQKIEGETSFGDLVAGRLFNRLPNTTMTLDLYRGHRHFTTTVDKVTEFISPNGLRAINLEIDFNTNVPAERELLAIRGARLALKEGNT